MCIPRATRGTSGATPAPVRIPHATRGASGAPQPQSAFRMQPGVHWGLPQPQSAFRVQPGVHRGLPQPQSAFRVLPAGASGATPAPIRILCATRVVMMSGKVLQACLPGNNDFNTHGTAYRSTFEGQLLFFLQSFLSCVAHIATTCLCMPLVATRGILHLRIPSLIILWAFTYLSESLLPL